jgi:UDP-N-acetylglucosamine 2-epimerase (non-hydrolysing)
VHVEAGLRSFDDDMPEEHNRIETDHLSALCLAPTDWAAKHLADEGIDGDRVVVTGNTAVDAVLDALPGPARQDEVLRFFGVAPDAFVLATIHRPENTDVPAVLRQVLEALGALPLPVVLPLHPRTRHRIDEDGLGSLLGPLQPVPPLRHADFLALAARSALLVSDSGGIQEEASVLKRPVLVVRRSTERPEVEGTFARLVGPTELTAAATRWLAELRRSPGSLAELASPYGDGTASHRCVTAIDAFLEAR